MPKANEYRPVSLKDIDRVVYCQSKETMFANKLVALIERHEQRSSIAGRDLYDIHHFFMQGFGYNQAIIKERRRVGLDSFFNDLIGFVKKNITQKVIDQDLNVLLPPDRFRALRKNIKQESLVFLQDEQRRLQAG